MLCSLGLCLGWGCDRAADVGADEGSAAEAEFADEGAAASDGSGEAGEPTGPMRIVSLVPNATELIFSIGAGDRLVGRSVHCDYPAEVRERPSIGSGLSPDIERILSLRPDLIIGAAMQEGQPDFAAFEEAEIPVLLLGDTTLEEIAASLAILGRELGHVDEARAVVEGLERSLFDIQQRVADRPRPRTMLVLDRDPLFAAGSATYLGQVLGVAGGENVFDSDWVRVDDEVLLHFDPEVIIEGNQAPDDAFWNRYAELSAVRDGRICRVDGRVMSRPGPRVAETAEAFARCLAAWDLAPTP